MFTNVIELLGSTTGECWIEFAVPVPVWLLCITILTKSVSILANPLTNLNRNEGIVDVMLEVMTVQKERSLTLICCLDKTPSSQAAGSRV